MASEIWPLTYFTNRTREEFDGVILDLQSLLSKDFKNQDRLINRIVNLFVDKFDPDYLLSKYKISISDKLEKAIKQTLNYAIDTEMLIRYIYYRLSEDAGEV